MAKKPPQNLLDLVPARLLASREREDGLVSVTVPHTGFFDRVAQRFFARPAESEIALDRFGSFVWNQIDGVRTVCEIGALLREHFGAEAEPLYERLSAFFGVLLQHRFIAWR